MTAEQEAATAAMYDEEARNADIVITTALIPGRPAPQLITAETSPSMKTGSVVVDMAAANGGNVALTQADERVVTDNLVTILGYTDLAGRLAAQTSQLYGTNVVNLFKLLTPGKDGELVLDHEDVVLRGITVTQDGDSLWPPPPVQVSAAPAAAGSGRAARAGREAAGRPAAQALRGRARCRPVRARCGRTHPRASSSHFTVFALAIFVGYYVISNVAHALHTPLMAETNAISGIILVGGILQVGSDNLAITVLALVAVLVASINIFGGFLVTARMLQMFRKD